MKKHIAIGIILFSSLGLLISCGESSSTNQSLDGQAYVLVDEGNLQNSSTSISGEGSIVFDSPLPGINSNSSFALQFSLEDGGQLSLVSHSNTTLESGIRVVFQRSGSTLSVELKTQNSSRDLSSLFAALDATNELKFQIDVHNSEEPAHILIWTGSDFEEDAAIANTEEAGQESPGNGSGSFWGLALNNTHVESAVVGDAQFVEGE